MSSDVYVCARIEMRMLSYRLQFLDSIKSILSREKKPTTPCLTFRLSFALSFTRTRAGVCIMRASDYARIRTQRVVTVLQPSGNAINANREQFIRARACTS